MFGSLRFLLAYLVILSHLVGTDYVAHFGFYAVRGFFVISGLMMTAALNEVYAFDGSRFWANRALRLLPPYYLVCGLTLLAIALAPAEAAQFQKFWRGLPDAGDLLANLTVLPLQLKLVAYTNNVAALSVTYQSGKPVAIARTVDFTNWVWLATNNAPYVLLDTNTSGASAVQFYRAQLP